MPARLGAPSERQVQGACIALLNMMDIPVYRVGQRDARGTQDPGVSDLIVLSPKLGVIFVEVKTEVGKQSGAQRDFETAVTRAGGTYRVVRSAHQLAQLLAPNGRRHE